MFPWGKYPFNDEIKKIAEQMNPADVHSYVNDMIKKLSSPPMENQADDIEKSNLTTQVFETFDYVYVRLNLPSHYSLEHIKIYHTSNQAIVEYTIEERSRQVITLPCLVKKKGTTAQIKDGILEIKLLKNVDHQFSEVAISDK